MYAPELTLLLLRYSVLAWGVHCHGHGPKPTREPRRGTAFEGAATSETLVSPVFGHEGRRTLMTGARAANIMVDAIQNKQLNPKYHLKKFTA